MSDQNKHTANSPSAPASHSAANPPSESAVSQDSPRSGRQRLFWLALLFFVVGAGLFIKRYADNRSIWLDEVFIARNIMERSYADLLEPMEYDQVAPIGFLWLVKFSTDRLGFTEYALRLVSLIAGISAIGLFYFVAGRCLRPGAAVIALGLFVIGEPLIFYVSETKQYAMDVAVCLTILLATLVWLQGRRGLLASLFLLTTGLLGVWLSHPSVFVLAGAGLTLLAREVWARRRASAVTLGLIGALWIANFLAQYVFFLRNLSHNPKTIAYWAGGFAPLPTSIENLGWYGATLAHTFETVAGLPAAQLAMASFTIGLIALARRDPWLVSILITPLAMALLASGIQAYPFSGRLLLYTVPLLLIPVAAGVSFAWRLPHGGKVVGATMLAMLAVAPTVQALRNAVEYPGKDEIRSVVSYLAEHIEPGDEIYLYHGARRAFDFYTKDIHRYRLPEVKITRGSSSKKSELGIGVYADDIDKLLGKKRVWVVFGHISRSVAGNEEKIILSLLDRVGTRLEDFIDKGASTYLYDLSLAAARQ